MSFLEDMEQHPKQKGSRWQRMLPMTVVVLLAVLAAASTLTFYRYMDRALFQERCSHFIEISDTVTTGN